MREEDSVVLWSLALVRSVGLAHLFGSPLGAQSGMVLSAVGLAALLACVLVWRFGLAAGTAVVGVPGMCASALRERALHSSFQRQRDPNAAGRPRPRAPSGGCPAA